jgi:hypothetical protein
MLISYCEEVLFPRLTQSSTTTPCRLSATTYCMSSPVQWIADGPRQHSRSRFRYICYFQTFTCFETEPSLWRGEVSDYYWSVRLYRGVTLLSHSLTPTHPHSWLWLSIKKSKPKLCYDWLSVGQSVLASSIHLGPKTTFLLLSVVGLLMWGAVSDERMGLSFTIAAGPRVRVPRDSWPHFTVSDLRLPQPGGPAPPIYIP